MPVAADGHFSKFYFVFVPLIFPLLGIVFNMQFVLQTRTFLTRWPNSINRNNRASFVRKYMVFTNFYNNNPMRVGVYFGSLWALLCTLVPFKEYAFFQSIVQATGIN